jgi:hypothetical protein
MEEINKLENDLNAIRAENMNLKRQLGVWSIWFDSLIQLIGFIPYSKSSTMYL